MDRKPAFGQRLGDKVSQLTRLRHIDLVQHDHARTIGEAAVLLQLVLNGLEITQRIAPGSRVAQSKTWAMTSHRST